jgi:hypothetical protein
VSLFDYDNRPATPGVILAGTATSAEAYRIRDFLNRNSLQYEWVGGNYRHPKSARLAGKWRLHDPAFASVHPPRRHTTVPGNSRAGRVGSWDGLGATGQATGRQAMMRTLSVGPPSLEQLSFEYQMTRGDPYRSPPLPIRVLSRLYDEPRLIGTLSKSISMLIRSGRWRIGFG